MKLGDYVRYRGWRKGDPSIEGTPLWKRGWGATGIIIELGDWRVGSVFLPGEMAIIWTGEEFQEVCTRDIEVISDANFVSSFLDNRASSLDYVV